MKNPVISVYNTAVMIRVVAILINMPDVDPSVILRGSLLKKSNYAYVDIIFIDSINRGFGVLGFWGFGVLG